MKLTIDYLEEERFFGGAVNDGIFMPYSAGFSRDLRVWHAGNQASSFLLSDRGRAIYSQKPFKYEFVVHRSVTAMRISVFEISYHRLARSGATLCRLHDIFRKIAVQADRVKTNFLILFG